VEFQEVVRRRRMVRSFRPDPVPGDVLGRILAAGQRVPSAGYSQGFELLVLEGRDETVGYWDATLSSDEQAEPEWRQLVAAPVLILPFAHPQAYVDRYAQPDKAATGLGESADQWDIPFWTVDTSFAAMVMLLAAVDEGLGALFFGLPPGGSAAVRSSLGVPDGFEPIGVIALGYAAADDRPSGSATTRPRRRLDDVVHRGTW
jgi:nitroreductase